MWEYFAVQKILTIFFNKNSNCICDIYFQNFNETLTKDVVNFKQLAPDCIRSSRLLLIFFIFMELEKIV